MVVAESAFRTELLQLGYQPLYQGKVGELYEVPDLPNQLLMMRSDRLSIFDFVLPCLVPQKGEVLIALTHYWLTHVFPEIPHHLLAWGRLPIWEDAGWQPENFLRLPLNRTLLIEKGEIWPYEMVYRAHLGGSVWNQYQLDGTAGGNRLPAGLKKWQKLDHPIFTPTTKVESGHDVGMRVNDYLNHGGEFGQMLMAMGRKVYQRAYQHAAERGILILDTKFEITTAGKLADEVLTPDSSRFTTPEDLAAAIQAGRDPVFYDKEPVRIWGRQVETPWGKGLNGLDPENEAHLAFITGLTIPAEIIKETSRRYLEIFRMITGMDLVSYQLDVMHCIGPMD